MHTASRRRQADVLKLARKVHRVTGALLFVFFMMIAVTGLLLGWKKNSGGLILAETAKGRSADREDWLPMHLLEQRAIEAIRPHMDAGASLEIDRFDVRPDRGVVKVLFEEDYMSAQLDCTTGEVLSIETRYSDLVENIHDGVILDRLFGIKGEPTKLVYTTVMGTSLLTFTITGFWLWYGPKRFKAGRKQNDQ